MISTGETIYALSSATGKSAVAVVRISGPACACITKEMAGNVPQPRCAVLRAIRHPRTHEALDRGLVLYFPGPGSATGEDLVEFQVHGGRAVLTAIFEALATFPACRPAEPGEFAKRGFENGKFDLTAAEGIADLIDADTEAQRRQAIQQANGALARLYGAWRERIIQAQALVEAAIDFSDEADVADGAIGQARTLARTLVDEVTAHLAGARRGEIIREGFRVVIAGPPNAGKSSLMNALARREAAIVSDEAGTTRDVVEVYMDLEGLAVTLSDTAGLREAGSHVEREGIRRALDRAHAADLVIWLEGAGEPASPPASLLQTGPRLLRVINKIDLVPDRENMTMPDGALAISAQHGNGIQSLVDAVISAATDSVAGGSDLVPANHRQTGLLAECCAHLDGFLSATGDHTELAAEDLRLAAGALGRVTGRIDVEDVLDQIFSRFCIGK